MDQKDKANLIAQLQQNKGFEILKEYMVTQMEALRNELENPNNPNLPFTQGQVFTYRSIFNYIDEKLRQTK